MLHGYGMKNIRDIVEQYNGMFQCKSQEDRFEVEREKLQYICSIFPNQSKRNKSTFGDGSVCLGWEYYDNPDTVNTAYCISDRDCITYSDAVAA